MIHSNEKEVKIKKLKINKTRWRNKMQTKKNSMLDLFFHSYPEELRKGSLKIDVNPNMGPKPVWCCTMCSRGWGRCPWWRLLLLRWRRLKTHGEVGIFCIMWIKYQNFFYCCNKTPIDHIYVTRQLEFKLTWKCWLERSACILSTKLSF